MTRIAHNILVAGWFILSILFFGYMTEYREANELIAMIPMFLWAIYVLIVFVFDPYKSQKKKCLYCGSEKIKDLADDQYYCNDCGNVWKE